jgi:hypothetical protein
MTHLRVNSVKDKPMPRFDPNEVTPIQSLLEDDLLFEKDFCTPLTVQRLEGIPIGALRVTVKKLAQLLPRCSFSTPGIWTPPAAPQPVLTIGRLDQGGKILAPRIALGVVLGQLRLCAEEEDIQEAQTSPDQWESWAISKRGTVRKREGFMAHKAPLTDKNREALEVSGDLLAFLQWFGRRSFGEGPVAWPKRIAEASRRNTPSERSNSPLQHAISAIPMTLQEAHQILPFSHAIKEAVHILNRAVPASPSPIQEAERQAALRYVRAFQLLAVECGVLKLGPDLDELSRDLDALSRRILNLKGARLG